jgi:hypothetical protein
MLRKIILGGQSGSDRSGLDFAIARGPEHGGFAPRGRKAEDGRTADHYNLVELTTSSYPFLNLETARQKYTGGKRSPFEGR